MVLSVQTELDILGLKLVIVTLRHLVLLKIQRANGDLIEVSLAKECPSQVRKLADTIVRPIQRFMEVYVTQNQNS